MRLLSGPSLLLLLLCACAPELAVPQGAQLTCASGSDCPEGLVCHAGRCLALQAVDTTVPDLAAVPAVSPAVGRAGTAFRVGLRATKPLASPPVLVLGLEAPVEVACEAEPAEPDAWACAWSATGTENGGAGGVVAFDVRLTDRASNTVTRRLAGALRLDFRAPDVLPTSASLVLTPPATSPLRDVSAAGPGTRVRVGFAVDEALGRAPVLQASPGALAFVQVGRTGDAYLYEAALPTSVSAQGPWALSVALEDTAGNTATRTLALPGAGLVVDTLPPAAPAVATPAAIVYARVPWGADATQGATRFDVRGAAGAAEPGTTVLVYDGADPTSAAELGRGPVRADGSFGPVDLGRADRPAVWVALADGAGNRSAPADVKDVAWTVTLGRKQPGSTFENPTTLRATPALRPVLAQDPAVALEPDAAGLAALARTDGVRLSRTTEQQWLLRAAAGPAPLPRYKLASAYDPDRGTLVVFGGYVSSLGRDVNDLWEWDPRTGLWTDRTGVGTRPAPTQAGALAYDTRRGRMVLVVGFPTVQTWEWNPDTGAWTDRTPSAPATLPPARTYFPVAYDAARGRVVLFGGAGAVAPYGPLDDVWEWDGASGSWTERTPAARPPAREQHTLAYDRTARRTVAFGGYGEGGLLVDLWEWDGAAGTWTHRPRASSTGPTTSGVDMVATGATLAHDAARGRLLLWGGSTSSAGLWEWDRETSTWRDRRADAAAQPCGTEQPAFVWDAARARAVLFAGVGSRCIGSSYTNQTWELHVDAPSDRAVWTQRTLGAEVPAARRQAAWAYDPVRRKAVLYGGMGAWPANGSAAPIYDDTWELDVGSGAWTRLASAASPGLRYGHAMAYDAARGSVILFGGTLVTVGSTSTTHSFNGETWEWRAGTWTRRLPATSPSARGGAALVATERVVTAGQPAQPRLLLFGGAGSHLPPDTTWEWDGAAGPEGSWVNVTPASGPLPATRSAPGLVWDPVLARALLYGGYEYATSVDRTDLWAWTNGAWSPLTPSTPAPPPRRTAFQLTFDPARAQLRLSGGGLAGGDVAQDTWEWDAASGAWAERTPALGGLPGRRDAVALFDPGRRASLVFGGSADLTGNPVQQLWEWDGGAQARGALVWTVPWAASGAGAVTLTRLDVRAVAGADGASGSGAALLGWDRAQEAWTALATNTAPRAVPAPLDARLTAPEALAGLWAGPTQALVFALAPGAPAGGAAALPSLEADALEVVVHYRRP